MSSSFREQFMQAVKFRHACKSFDDNKKISEEDIRYILEVGRMSPSSFGQEAWKFLVITNEALKAELRLACGNQAQITSCSHLVLILTGIEDVKVESGIPRKRFERQELPQDKIDMFMGIYDNFLKKIGTESEKNIYAWTAKQTYIAAGNMMNAAAVLGVDSCAIEGFSKSRVEKILELDTSKFQLSLVLPFGYRAHQQSSHIRLPFDEVVEFIR